MYQFHSPRCPISKTMLEHYKGILVGILLGIIGTLVGQNVQTPAWMKKDDVPPDPKISTTCVGDPPTPNTKAGIIPSSPVPPNNPPSMSKPNAPPATELPLPTDPPKLPLPTELRRAPNGLPYPNDYIPPAPPR